MHIYRIFNLDDEWLPLFGCTIKEFKLEIRFSDQLPKSSLVLVEN